MINRLRPLRACLIALLAVAAVGLGCNRSGAAARKKFYWVQPVRGHPVHQLTQLAFRKECAELGYDCEIIGTDAMDVPQLNALGEQALARGDAAGMAVWAGSSGTNRLIEQAGKAGVPVVVPHFPTEQGTVPGLTGVISCDPAAYGREAALAIGQQINGEGEVAITQGGFNVTENLVSESFTKAMGEAYPKVKVLPPQEEGFDPIKAVARAAAILQGNPGVVGALSTTGGVPPTWPAAQKQVGRKIVSITMNYTRANLDAIRDGQMYAAVAQPLWEESVEAAKLLDRAVRGEKIPAWTKLPAPLITKDKLEPYYKLMDQVDAEAR